MDSTKVLNLFAFNPTHPLLYTPDLFIMALVFLLVEKRQSEIIQEEAKKRGMAIAQNLAPQYKCSPTYNYVSWSRMQRESLLKTISSISSFMTRKIRCPYSQHSEKQDGLYG